MKYIVKNYSDQILFARLCIYNYELLTFNVVYHCYYDYI